MAVVSFQGLGEKYEKLFYEEATYGQVREREGRRGGLVNIMNMRSIPPPPGTTTTLYQS